MTLTKRSRLRDSPWPASLLVLLIYTACIVAQSVLAQQQPAPPGTGALGSTPTAMEQVLVQLPTQLGLIILLTGIVGLLAWWRQVGIADLELGDLRFALGPSLSALPLLALGILFDAQAGVGYLGAGSLRALIGVVALSLIAGYTQELVFRGILFHGATAQFGPVIAVVLTAALYSLFHFFNLLEGQGIGLTISQVIHAATDGFLYGAVRLTTGSLWPTVLVRGLWELSMASAHTGLQHLTGGAAQTLAGVDAGGITVRPMQVLLPLLNGSLMLWRWSARQQRARMDMVVAR